MKRQKITRRVKEESRTAKQEDSSVVTTDNCCITDCIRSKCNVVCTTPESESFECPESSNIAGATYLFRSQELFVEFRSNHIYRYFKPTDSNQPEGFPINMWEDFKAAESKGKYVNGVIKAAFMGEKQ